MVSRFRTIVQVRGDADVVSARVGGRLLAGDLGFLMADIVAIATSISEVARNIVRYAESGTVELTPLSDGGRIGIQVVARDDGPGIADIATALRDGYSTGNGLGLGLPGCQRLMDELEITSGRGVGTTVVMRKWLS
jgi:serine/threonine-protein kinase RsbT